MYKILLRLVSPVVKAAQILKVFDFFEIGDWFYNQNNISTKQNMCTICVNLFLKSVMFLKTNSLSNLTILESPLPEYVAMDGGYKAERVGKVS